MKALQYYRLLFILLISLCFQPLQSLAQSNDPTGQYFEISKSLEIFGNVFKELNQSYVNPIQPGKMTKAGINAMLAGLDPYTNFFTEADGENFRIHASGQYGGIGIVTRTEDSNLVVDQVFEGAPADKAGLHPGDILLSVNGQNLKGRSNDELDILMQGDKGSTVEIKIKNPVSGAEKSLSITRSTITISNVPYASLLGKNKDIAYVSLSQFMGHASDDVHRALDSLKKVQPNLKGVVLDLRDNPGGLLKEAVRICNLFLPEGQEVVTTKGKNENWQQVFATTGQPWNTEIPVAVLVNHQSASASEIVAGTMQDLDRGVIIGTRSFGKGLVQQVRPVGFNTSLKLTVAHYYTPSGRCIQALDYAHRNRDGSVSKIPDSLQNSFKTKNGRIVKDGGGIKPDIFISEEEPNSMLQTLINNNFLFNYATKYFYSHPHIAPPENFMLDQKDFADFQNWLAQQDFLSQTTEGALLGKFKTEAEADGQFDKMQQEYNALKLKLTANHTQALSEQEQLILNLLSTEIAGRYYYQKGATLNRLSQDDPTLKKALDILSEPKAYERLLK